MIERLRYGVVTAARDEASNLPRLAACLAAQTLLPSVWVIVENGSEDETPALVEGLVDRYPWIVAERVPGDGSGDRGPSIVRAFTAGLARLPASLDIVANVDADIAVETDYFDRLVSAFEADSSLGIASGSAWEERRGAWSQQHVTRGSVWGASRAYRRACLEDVTPLEERVGWDGIDELRANARGWRTRTLTDLPFRHYRPEGKRDGAVRRWQEQGRLAYFMGYRPSYLVMRTLFRATRNPAALAMLPSYLIEGATRTPRLPDPAARDYLRRQQGLRALPVRMQEALGRLTLRG